MTWEAAERVQKNDQGQFRAMIGGKWIPVAKAQKDDSGAFRVMRAGPSAAEQISGDRITQEALKGRSGIAGAIVDAFPQGLVGGSPMGVLTSAAGKSATDLMDRAAYKTGEKVTDWTGSPELGYAANVGVQALPVLAGGELGKQAHPVFRSAAERLMQSALKPNAKSVAQGKAARAIATMLDEGHNVTPGGVRGLQAKSSALSSQVDDILRSTHGAVIKGSAGARIQDAITKTERFNPTPQDYVAQMERVANQYHGNPLVPDKIPLPQAQELKQGIYKALGDASYGELGSATKEAQKALARGLREELERAAPSIATLNARNSDILNALRQVRYRSAMSGNKNPMGLALLPHHPAAAAMFMADRSELIKSLLARGLNSGAQPTGQMLGAGLGAYSGRTEQ